MTDKELITKLQILKEIKPRKDWVLLSKTNIFSQTQEPIQAARFSSISRFLFSKKLVYSFATLLLLLAGVTFFEFGMPKNQSANLASTSEASLLAQANLKSNVEEFKIKSKNLADVIKGNPQNSDVAIKAVKDAAKGLTDTIEKNPELAKTIALDINNNKTLLDVPGGNNTGEVVDMYRAIVIPLFEDLKGRTLTKDEEVEVERIEAAFNNGGSSTTALRDILLMNANSKVNTDIKDSKK